MGHERAAAEFRAAAQRAGPRGAGRRYPAALQRQAAKYLQQRRAAGASASAAARELGVKRHTLLTWAAEGGVAAGFVPVRVVSDAAPTSKVVVHAPGGLRIEGLDVAGVIALLRGLA